MGNYCSCVKANPEAEAQTQPQIENQLESPLRRSFSWLRSSPRPSLPDPTLLLLDPGQCTVTWNQPNPSTVGELTVATVQFIRRNLTPYTLEDSDVFTYEVVYVSTDNTRTAASTCTVQCFQEPVNLLAGHETVKVSFVARMSGDYQVNLNINNKLIGGQVHVRSYIAGPPDPNKTLFRSQRTHVITRCDEYQTTTFCPKDRFDNPATFDKSLFNFAATMGGPDGAMVSAHINLSRLNQGSDYYNLSWRLDTPGYYEGCIKYSDSTMGLKNIQIYCLTDEGMSKVDENFQQMFLRIGYEAQLLSTKKGKPRNVQCFISPRLFQVRDSTFFGLIHGRAFTCRVCHATKLIMHQEPDVFTMEDGLRNTVTLRSAHREVIAAVFHKFVQRNAGGENMFADKKNYFSAEVHKLPAGSGEVSVTVDRAQLLRSAMSATRRMNPKDWRKHFFVIFKNEPGIDVGGVCRELFVCLCDQLFGADDNTGLFMRFIDSKQGLVHPTPLSKRNSKLKLKHYEFAGKVVGKCLYETAIGNPLFVKAHFTRSFLAQIIGLRVTWKHFETDDPDLYKYKIAQIRDHSISDLELSMRFTEDVYEEHDGVMTPTIIPLSPDGENKRVTDDNKMEYLNEVAQFRLVSQVSEEIIYFLKGLHQIIPEELLSIFNESELELLMCGMQEISFADMRQHTEVRGIGPHFDIVMEWFWAVVQEFTQEELSRLMQFVTGSSQLPPGGFKELRPPFLIYACGGASNRLPYAHTCFNHLCLPDYDTFEQFRRCLLMAINEGNEGFLLE